MSPESCCATLRNAGKSWLMGGTSRVLYIAPQNIPSSFINTPLKKPLAMNASTGLALKRRYANTKCVDRWMSAGVVGIPS